MYDEAVRTNKARRDLMTSLRAHGISNGGPDWRVDPLWHEVRVTRYGAHRMYASVALSAAFVVRLHQHEAGNNWIVASTAQYASAGEAAECVKALLVAQALAAGGDEA